MSGQRQKKAAAANLIGSAIADPEREFAFSDEDFRTLSKLAYEHAGIVLTESKRNLIYGRLSRRLRALSITSFRDYRAYLMGERSAPSDLMSWNADATRMPYRMHSDYLRRLFLNDDRLHFLADEVHGDRSAPLR